jgi:2'-5' RNA ligase
MVSPTHSALIVTVPAADPIVGHHRSRYDRAASWGVPAHVTVLFPFVPPDQIAVDTIERVAVAVASVPAFTAAFNRTAWFGEDVVFLAPTPTEPFVQLTAAVAAAFPEHPPYEGAHDDVVPHLTVAHGAPSSALREVELDVEPQLPITTHVTAVEWWRGRLEARAWTPFRQLPLGLVRGLPPAK